MNADEFFNQASVKFERGDLFGAISDWTQGISLTSNFAPIYYQWGVNQYSHGFAYHGEAIKNFTLAIKCYPDYAQAYYYRALIYYSQGEYQKAIEDFTAVIRICSENNINDGAIWDRNFANREIFNQAYKIGAYQNRAYARSYLGDNRSSMEDFTEIISIKPTENHYYNRGTLHYILGDYQQAIADLTEALNLKPDSADAYYNRGNARYELGDESGALEDYDRAGRIDEENGDRATNDEHAAYGRAIARSRIGNIQGAIEDLQTATQLCSKYRNMAFYQKVTDAIKSIQP